MFIAEMAQEHHFSWDGFGSRSKKVCGKRGP